MIALSAYPWRWSDGTFGVNGKWWQITQDKGKIIKGAGEGEKRRVD